jgi:hypothetical protein
MHYVEVERKGRFASGSEMKNMQGTNLYIFFSQFELTGKINIQYHSFSSEIGNMDINFVPFFILINEFLYF